MRNKSRTTKGMKPGERRFIARGIFAYKSKANGEIVYGISYVTNGKRVRETVGPTKTLAKDALSLRTAEIVIVGIETTVQGHESNNSVIVTCVG